MNAYNADVKQAVLDADAAINREDLDAVADFYADDAVLVLEPGVYSRGKAEIRKALAAIADHVNHSLQVTQKELVVIETGDTALVLASCCLEAKAKTDSPFSMVRRSTYVFKKDSSADGSAQSITPTELMCYANDGRIGHRKHCSDWPQGKPRGTVNEPSKIRTNGSTRSVNGGYRTPIDQF